MDPTLAATHALARDVLHLPAEIPKHVRAFGYHPPVTALEPGDLLLFAPKSPDLTQRSIINDQERAFHPADARWTHAAIYLYDAFIVEATKRKGTGISYLHDYIPTYDILVRRHTANERLRTRIVLHALTLLDKPYPIVRLGTHIVKEWFGKRKPSTLETYWVCSELFHRTSMQATTNLLHGCPPAGLTKPAHLSQTSSLNDVAVSWMSVVDTPVAPSGPIPA